MVRRFAVCGVLAGAGALYATPVLAQVLITPDTAPPPLQNVQSVAIDPDTGRQFDPHVDGNLISYTYDTGNGNHVRYFRFGVDTTPSEIPIGQSEQDLLSHVSDGRVAYSHVEGLTTSVNVFDTTQPASASNPFVVNPQADVSRFRPAIRGNTIAYIDTTLEPHGELVVYDLTTNTAQRLTDDAAADQNASLSPDGNTVVWEHCEIDTNHCDIWQGVRSGATWTISAVSSDPANETLPDTTGSVHVYSSDRPSGAGDIYFRNAGGAIEFELALAGVQAASHISGDFIAFAGNSPGEYDIFLYQRSTNRLWNLTNSPEDDLLSDISTLPNGDVIVVYESVIGLQARTGVRVMTFTVPPAATDNVPPTISIVTPADGAVYTLNSAVAAQYSCSDSGSGIASCRGTVANGAAVPTASAGPHTFSVAASDVAGNTSTASAAYTVSYKICALYDPNKAKKSGSTYPIQIQLCDANDQNVSSSAVVVHAESVTQLSTNAAGVLDDAGNSNPDFDFRYDAASGSYMFNLKTSGLGTGTYSLGFTAGADPVVHSAPFQIK